MSGALRFDVVVVGGGLAGVGAAIGAARQGAHTLLAERFGALGGNAIQAWVHTLCGLYAPVEDGVPRCVHAGLPRRFAAGLREAGGAGAPERAGRVWFLPVEPQAVSRHATGLCDRMPGLAWRTDWRLVEASGGRADEPWRLAFETPGGRSVVEAPVAVDATGDAALAAAAGAAVAEESADTLQCASWIFRLEGVEPGALAGMARLQLSHGAVAAHRSGAFPPGCESVLARPALRPGEVFVTLNVPRLEGWVWDPLDDDCRAAHEAWARQAAARVSAWLRASRPGFGASRIAGCPPRLGIRETRRLRGRAELGRDDVLEGRRRDDEVALSSWPIELWTDHRRARFAHPTGPCSVPLGALVSASHPRLATAGRCMAGSHEALGALRVLGTALATGEAAGVAAALAADAGGALGEVEPAAVRARIAAAAEAGP